MQATDDAGVLRIPRPLSRRWDGDVLSLVVPPALITFVLWLTSINSVSWVEVGAAFLLLCLPFWEYRNWQRTRTVRVPFFALVGFMFWIYFALPVFWGNRVDPGIFSGILADSVITQAMLMAVAGVVALWLGMRLRLGHRFALRYDLALRTDSPRTARYLRFLLVLAVVINLFPDSQYIAGETFRQPILALGSIIPLIVFAYLFRAYLQGHASQIDRYTIALFAAAQLVLGLGGGWIGSWLDLVIIAVITYLAERHRIPRAFILLALVYAIFFQAGKQQFRSVYWYGGGQQQTGSVVQRAQTWVQLSIEQWQSILSDPRDNLGPQILSGLVQRASLLNLTGRVLYLTPQPVPYQYGNTYTPILANFAPRLLWPDKPSVNAANQYFQVAYGLTLPQDLSQSSIACGILAEGYMNFGWVGAILVMFLLGIVFSWVEASFLSRQTGLLAFAIGTYLVVKFLFIEGQMAQYLGGVVQILAIAFLVFLPASRIVRLGTDATASGGEGEHVQ